MSRHKHKHEHTESHCGQGKCPQALAYKLWEQAGRPEGQSERFWKEAEDQASASASEDIAASASHATETRSLAAPVV